MSSVLPFTDIVFGNETEAAAYAESFGLNTTDVGEIAMKIAQLPKVLIPLFNRKYKWNGVNRHIRKSKKKEFSISFQTDLLTGEWQPQQTGGDHSRKWPGKCKQRRKDSLQTFYQTWEKILVFIRTVCIINYGKCVSLNSLFIQFSQMSGHCGWAWKTSLLPCCTNSKVCVYREYWRKTIWNVIHFSSNSCVDFNAQFKNTRKPHKEVHSIYCDLWREEIVDTNGAGDAFVGGFLAQQVPMPQLVTAWPDLVS